MTEPGKVIVPRDPSRDIDKAEVNNYRRIRPGDSERCWRCRHRQDVPYCWCDMVGRTVITLHVCDKFAGGKEW